MRARKYYFLLLIHFLLSDLVLSQTQPPPHFRNRIGSGSFLSIVPLSPEEVKTDEQAQIDPVRRLLSDLTESLHGYLDLRGNVSCVDLEAGPWKGAGFSGELLGLVMIPVLVSAGCELEAEDLLRNLSGMLGLDDTRELLDDVVALIRRSLYHSSTSTSMLSKPSGQSERHLQALMFNIKQLAKDEYMNADVSGVDARCQGWTRIKDMVLSGQKFDPGMMRLNKAKHVCRKLGFVCSGVTQDPTSPDIYHVILRPSWLLPSVPPNQSESWIQSCRAWHVRWRRHATHGCSNEKEERVYKVVEWIPAVSTFYNLGTAVYYASVSCTETAKERALMSAVDLGTDALVAATGGSAGVAGYALGAGLKTSVKAGVRYLLNRMKEEEDLIMNRDDWESGTASY